MNIIHIGLLHNHPRLEISSLLQCHLFILTYISKIALLQYLNVPYRFVELIVAEKIKCVTFDNLLDTTGRKPP